MSARPCSFFSHCLQRGSACGVAALGFLMTPTLAHAEGGTSRGLANLDFHKLLEAGGGVGVVIGALSVGMAALVFEYLISLRREATIPRKLAEQLGELIGRRQFKQAADECRHSGSLLGSVVGAGLAELDAGYPAAEKAMEDACAQYAGRLYRKIDYLSVIGTLSPMLGLLGTVWGMMLAFSEFASKANVAVTELAPGISTALVTTLLGLAVAIPAYAAYAYFRNRVDEAVANCSQVAEHIFFEYRRDQVARRRKARAIQLRARTQSDRTHPAFPPVAIEREKSA
ncbi:MAG TPA: MotA/TolQ/ExbB proton channel family protein [Planctomycetaceae bacterium]|jgi:biopolymer transport protein ExbB|nr:MotA/TolQ/ExbB proton channel family protein [Planctomycetaceae bacterium]